MAYYECKPYVLEVFQTIIQTFNSYKIFKDITAKDMAKLNTTVSGIVQQLHVIAYCQLGARRFEAFNLMDSAIEMHTSPQERQKLEEDIPNRIIRIMTDQIHLPIEEIEALVVRLPHSIQSVASLCQAAEKRNEPTEACQILGWAQQRIP